VRDISDERWNGILTFGLRCVQRQELILQICKADYFKDNNHSQVMTRDKHESLCRRDNKYYKEMKCVTGLQKHLDCVWHRSVKVKHSFQHTYYFVDLQCFSSQFPISANFHHTVAVAGHLGTSAKMSRPKVWSLWAMVWTVSALGPKCLGAELS